MLKVTIAFVRVVLPVLAVIASVVVYVEIQKRQTESDRLFDRGMAFTRNEQPEFFAPGIKYAPTTASERSEIAQNLFARSRSEERYAEEFKEEGMWVVIAIMVAWVVAMLPVLFRRALRPILVRITREVIAIKSEAKSHR